MGPVRVKDVEEAQQKVVAVIRRLEEAGTIVIVRGGEDQLVCLASCARVEHVGGAPSPCPLRTAHRAAAPTRTRPRASPSSARRDAERVLAQARRRGRRPARSRPPGGLRRRARRRPRRGRRHARRPAADAPAGLAAQRERLEEAAVREATALAVEIAARLVRAEVAVNPERVADVIRGAIRRAADRVAAGRPGQPDRPGRVPRRRPRILEEMGGIGRLEVVDDPRVGAGSCVLADRPPATWTRPSRASSRRVLEALVGAARRVARRARPREHGRPRPGARAPAAPRPLPPQRPRLELIGLVVESRGPEASVGERCEIIDAGPPHRAPAAAGRGRRLPRGHDAADAARRLRRHRPRPDGGRDRRRRARRRRPRACSAGCSTASAARSTAGPPVHVEARRADRRAAARRARPPHHPHAPAARRAGDRRPDALRARSAHRHLRRLGRRQEHHPGHDGPRHQRRRQRDRPGRRARPRGARVHRARPRAGGPRPQRRRGGHLRPAGARAHQGGLRRHHDRRVLPRPGRRRAADDGLGHAPGHGPARGRPRHRRAAGDARLHAVGVRDCCRGCSSAPAPRRWGASPRSTPCWWTATT